MRALKVTAWVFGIWLILAAINLMSEKTACSVDVVNPETNWRVDGVTPDCSEINREVRKFGNRKYAKVDNHIYWMSDRDVRDKPNCLIGLGCLHSIVKEHLHIRDVKLIDLGGAIDFEKMRGYLDGDYVSDGYTLLNDWRKVPRLNPPVTPSKLRRISGEKAENSQYVTDGTWVLYEGRHVAEANIPTFQVIPQPVNAPKNDVRFAHDKNAVYYGDERIPEADPASFELVVLPQEDLLEGYYGLDRNNVWDLSGTPKTVTPEFSGKIRKRANWIKRSSGNHSSIQK
jgi:hypothetical protein